MSQVQPASLSASASGTAIGPHIAFKQLPLVDISLLYSADPVERKQAACALGQAARDAGFLYVVGHDVPTSLIEKLKVRTRGYFAQPHEQKMVDYIGDSQNHSGYVPEGEEQFYGAKPDLKEAYDVGFDFADAEHRPEMRRPMLGPNRWTEFPGFKADIKAYYEAMFALSKVLFRGFALALGLTEDNFTQRVSTPPSQLRLVHYPFNPDVATGRPGIGAHTDYECFTILLPTADGLEVQNGAGEWIDAPVVEGAFVINIGDMLEVMSNGQYVATMHRVRKVQQERYSFPFFCACDYDTVIAPISSLAPGGSTRTYEPVVCGNHLYAQTMQTFAYLKKRLAEGTLALPDGAKGLSSFGHKPDEKIAQGSEVSV